MTPLSTYARDRPPDAPAAGLVLRRRARGGGGEAAVRNVRSDGVRTAVVDDDLAGDVVAAEVAELLRLRARRHRRARVAPARDAEVALVREDEQPPLLRRADVDVGRLLDRERL